MIRVYFCCCCQVVSAQNTVAAQWSVALQHIYQEAKNYEFTTHGGCTWWVRDRAVKRAVCLTWMCCCVMSQGLCASSLLSVCRLRSLVGACSRPLSQLSSPPASRKPALCCCTRYRHWCRAAACRRKMSNRIPSYQKPDSTPKPRPCSKHATNRMWSCTVT